MRRNRQGNPRMSNCRKRTSKNWFEGQLQGVGRSVFPSYPEISSFSRKRPNLTPSHDFEPSFKKRKWIPRSFEKTNLRSKENHKNRPSGFKYLKNLIEKDPEELILELSKKEQQILNIIQNNLTDDSIVLIVRILRTVSVSCFNESKCHILQTYLNETFVERLVNYILQLPMQNQERQEKNQFFWNEPQAFWKYLFEICENIGMFPQHHKNVSNILKSLEISFLALDSQKKIHIAEETKTQIQKLKESFENNATKSEAENKSSANDFRQMSVYPKSCELLNAISNVVRKNVIDGPYKDVDDYLDIQFRLLREDFIAPLRTAIASVRSEKNPKNIRHIDNITVYNKVRFLNPETVSDQCCVRLCFDSSKRRFWNDNSKKFMFGSLLCFTLDNFNSVIFGKVAERKLEDLQKGQLIVGLSEDVLQHLEYNVDYLMIESGIYFEPYFNVLTALQKINANEYPMEKYIIHVQRLIQAPQYLTKVTKYKIQQTTFNPTLEWPNINFYNMNQAQLTAFKAALSQEFCIIQGPPGTGKTFLGLKIAKTLLQNQKIWYNKTPMLVICYTNHALDQFLEGLTKFTPNILRVGGRSRNENLDSYNLRKKTFGFEILQNKRSVQEAFIKIKITTKNLEMIESCTGIVNFNVFEDVVLEFEETCFYKAETLDILSWLLHLPKRTVISVSGNSFQVEEQRDRNNSKNEADKYNYDFCLNEDADDNIFKEVRLAELKYNAPCFTIDQVELKIQSLESDLKFARHRNRREINYMQDELRELRNFYWHLKEKLAECKQRVHLNKETKPIVDLNNPFNIPPDDRWNLYFYWLNLYKEKLESELSLYKQQFRKVHATYNEIRTIHNTNIMKDSLVIGMTTTGAARLRLSLQALKSPIVIVEEAAEVLEAHIVSSLTKHCKHLILIGDHKQLRPSTADFQIGRKCKLEVSLFERMVLNNIQLHTLNVQHRMRPEISSLISPSIYPALEDDASVKGRLSVKGVDKCVFFIDHNNKETKCDETSKKNLHEVDFLIHFAKHLILNGYEPESITILAAYLGQKFEIQKEKKQYEDILKNVRVEVLDNYQGEECDIILLSLVRNNKENKIGFLSVENRVCVALSRAKLGLYIMGNINQLCSVSELWKKVRNTLEQQDALGGELPLRCQVHQDKVTLVKTGNDIAELRNGGCNQKCGTTMKCGHVCLSCCHIDDRNHEREFKCLQKCTRSCDVNSNHLCKKKCYEQCGPCKYVVERSLSCGHVANMECHADPQTYKCKVLVPTKLPCEHETDKPCYENPQTFPCPHPCQIKVEPCGHACKLTCHITTDPDHVMYQCRKKCVKHLEGCTSKTREHLCPKFCFEKCEPCNILIPKKRSLCDHLAYVPCSKPETIDDSLCEDPCSKMLPCGHPCKKRCHQPCGNCEIKLTKTLQLCGHSITAKCSEPPDRKFCNRKCPLKLPCGHDCTKKCNEPCTSFCTELVTCSLKSPCGHLITQSKCWLVNSENDKKVSKILLEECSQPCSQKLKCDHMCSGTCSECYQGRIHKRCNEKCGFPLICNHLCNFPCRKACQPCKRRCVYKCTHSFCSKRCGEACTPCREKCTRKCPHQKCTLFCGEICQVPPCNLPCRKKLNCGHRCVGFCGDPCPSKCLICDKEELTAIFLGHEEDEDARFVLLSDCGHIFESKGLELWLHKNDYKIGMKECPGCKTPIISTQRYSDVIKRNMLDIAKVKTQFYGSIEEISGTRYQLLAKVKSLKKCQYNLKVLLKLTPSLQHFEKRLQPTLNNKNQPINKVELNAVQSKLQILEYIFDMFKHLNSCNLTEPVVQSLNLIKKVVDREHTTDQEIQDLKYELNRLSRIIDYTLIKLPDSKVSSKECTALAEQIERLLFGFEIFSDENEATVQNLLKKFSKLTSGLPISEKERRDIVKAMGFKQGHWYKCPNGHIYAIGNCGGAMQEAKCPECKAKIGGKSHTLTEGNSVATEMDGARYSAWSEQANMENYRFD